MKMNYTETSIPRNYTLYVADDSNGFTTLPENYVEPMVRVAILAIADYAKVVKSKEKPVAVIIDDYKGNMLFAAVVKHHEGEGDMPGNWSLEFTFKEEDIADCERRPISEQSSHKFFYDRAKEIRMTYNSPTHIFSSCLAFINTLIQFLDENARVEEEVEVELAGSFLASVIVEGEEKIMSIVPDGEIKKLIKDDAALETA